MCVSAGIPPTSNDFVLLVPGITGGLCGLYMKESCHQSEFELCSASEVLKGLAQVQSQSQAGIQIGRCISMITHWLILDITFKSIHTTEWRSTPRHSPVTISRGRGVEEVIQLGYPAGFSISKTVQTWSMNTVVSLLSSLVAVTLNATVSLLSTCSSLSLPATEAASLVKYQHTRSEFNTSTLHPWVTHTA